MEKFKNEEKCREAMRMLYEFAIENGSNHLSVVIFTNGFSWCTDYTNVENGEKTYRTLEVDLGKEEE